MRVSASWWVLVCLSIAGCSDDDNGQSEDAVMSADASTEDSKESDKDTDTKKSSGSGGKAGSERTGNGGAGGSKSASSSGSSDKDSPDAKGDDEKKDESKEESKPSEGDKGDEGKGSEGEKDKSEGDKPAGSETSGGSESEPTKEGESTSGGSTPATNGDQLAVCSRTEGDCNQGLACRAPAGPFSPGRGFCSKICRQDEDCAGLAPEGSKYVCSDGPGVSTCELTCSGAEDASCPAAMACVQTGVRRRPASTDGAAESSSDAGTPRGPAYEPLFNCRHPFQVSKLWEQCGDASRVCGEGLRCAAAFWFGGAGHCTKGCESDADCAKPESGSAKPSCMTLVPAFGETPAVKQCVLNCAEAKDGCPNGLSCFEGPQTRSEEGAESMPAFAWCQ